MKDRLVESRLSRLVKATFPIHDQESLHSLCSGPCTVLHMVDDEALKLVNSTLKTHLEWKFLFQTEQNCNNKIHKTIIELQHSHHK